MTSSFIDSAFISHLDTPYDLLLKCLLIGNSGVGKSAIVDRYVDHTFNSTFISTIGVDFRPVDFETSDGQTAKLQIWDTAGQERFRSIATAYYRGVHGIILTYDMTDPESIADLQDVWIREVDNYAKVDVVLVLVGNKADLASQPRFQRHAQEVQARVSEFRERYPTVLHFEVSAKTGEGVNELFQTLCGRLVEVQSEKQARLRREEEETQSSRRVLLGRKLGDSDDGMFASCCRVG